VTSAILAATCAAFALGCWMAGVVLARSAVPLRRATSAPSARGASVARRAPAAWLGGTRVGRRLVGSSLAVLEAAGWSVTPQAFAGIRMLAAAAGLVAGLALPWPGRALAPLLAVLGGRLPTIAAGRAAARRRAALDADVPQLLDLLAAASSAGLSAQLALRRAVHAIDGPLAGELEAALERVDLGARWRDELAELVRRSGSTDLARAASVLSRTETLGVSLQESTSELAASVRSARRAAITERARTAPVKMLFPLVFLVLPAFLLLTVVPVLLTTLQSIR
jgi:tight adherence protein C